MFLFENLIRESTFQVIYFIFVNTCFLSISVYQFK